MNRFDIGYTFKRKSALKTIVEVFSGILLVILAYIVLVMLLSL